MTELTHSQTKPDAKESMKGFRCQSCGGSIANFANADTGVVTCSHCGSVYHLPRPDEADVKPAVSKVQRPGILRTAVFVIMVSAVAIYWFGGPEEREAEVKSTIEQGQASDKSKAEPKAVIVKPGVEQEPRRVEAVPDHQGHRLNRTRNLGLQFVQTNEPMLMSGPIDLGGVGRPGRDPLSFTVMTLKRHAFEIRLPTPRAQDEASVSPVLWIAMSTDPSVFIELAVGQSIEKTPFFEKGTGMADFDFGSGSLGAMSKYDGRRGWAHNHIVEGRFNASEPGYLGLFVSAIFNYYQDVDFIEKGRPIYAVFYVNVDEDPDPDVLKRTEVDLIKFKFED